MITMAPVITNSLPGSLCSLHPRPLMRLHHRGTPHRFLRQLYHQRRPPFRRRPRPHVQRWSGIQQLSLVDIKDNYLGGS